MFDNVQIDISESRVLVCIDDRENGILFLEMGSREWERTHVEMHPEILERAEAAALRGLQTIRAARDYYRNVHGEYDPEVYRK